MKEKTNYRINKDMMSEHTDDYLDYGEMNADRFNKQQHVFSVSDVDNFDELLRRRKNV